MADRLGICPAAVSSTMDGIHGGDNAGRSCWIVAGTFCGGQAQGSYAQKLVDCMRCEFYRRVKKEEGAGLAPPSVLLKRLD